MQIELLKRLLTSELKTVARRNLLAERKFSEMLERAMRSYTNRSWTLPKSSLSSSNSPSRCALSRTVAPNSVYAKTNSLSTDAVRQNDSAIVELGDDTLKAIAHELVDIVRRNATVDWDKKEQVRASLRRHIRRLLTKYHYPARQAGVGRSASHAAGRAFRSRGCSMRHRRHVAGRRRTRRNVKPRSVRCAEKAGPS